MQTKELLIALKTTKNAIFGHLQHLCLHWNWIILTMNGWVLYLVLHVPANVDQMNKPDSSLGYNPNTTMNI